MNSNIKASIFSKQTVNRRQGAKAIAPRTTDNDDKQIVKLINKDLKNLIATTNVSMLREGQFAFKSASGTELLKGQKSKDDNISL